jgi:hypothetical protein
VFGRVVFAAKGKEAPLATAKIDIGAPLSDAWAEISEVMRWPAWKDNCDLAQEVDNAKMGRDAHLDAVQSTQHDYRYRGRCRAADSG